MPYGGIGCPIMIEQRRGSMQMTNEQQLDLVENHLDDIFTLCGSYAESGTEEDLANIRAIYAEYEEWLDICWSS